MTVLWTVEWWGIVLNQSKTLDSGICLAVDVVKAANTYTQYTTYINITNNQKVVPVIKEQKTTTTEWYEKYQSHTKQPYHTNNDKISLTDIQKNLIKSW